MSKPYFPPLKSLHYFLVAAQLSSFKLAAIQLHVTQAAISQQIKLLEDYFDFSLFVRKTRQVHLSEKGRQLLPFIEKGFAHLHEGIKQLSGDPKPNILRISAINSFTSIWLLPRLHTFQSKYPNIMIQIAPTNELVDFNNDEIDLAIRMGKGEYKGLRSTRLIQEEMLLIASPSIISNKDAVNPAEVFALPWIEDTSTDVALVFDVLCKLHDVAPANIIPIIRADNSVTIIDNVMQGRGFALANRSLVLEHITAGTLISLLDFSHPSPFSLFLVAPAHNFEWQKVMLFERWLVPLLHESFGQ